MHIRFLLREFDTAHVEQQKQLLQGSGAHIMLQCYTTAAQVVYLQRIRQLARDVSDRW